MPATAPRPEERQQFLSFFLAGEEYGVEILRIREVVEYQRLTTVPTTPSWVRGVMNLRGTVVPVLDLAAKFQRTETRVEKQTCIVIFEVDLEGDPTPVGVMIDKVGRVLELSEGEIQQPPAVGSPVRPELLDGIGMPDEKPIALLNIQRVLTEDELTAAVAGTEALDAAGDQPKALPKDKTKTKAQSKEKTKAKAKTAPKTPRKPKPRQKSKPQPPASPAPPKKPAASAPDTTQATPKGAGKKAPEPSAPDRSGSTGSGGTGTGKTGEGSPGSEPGT